MKKKRMIKRKRKRAKRRRRRKKRKESSNGCDLGRFCGHIDAAVEDGDGEVRVGIAGEPQAELRVADDLVGLDLPDQDVQTAQPRDRQVTVCQEYPVTLCVYACVYVRVYVCIRVLVRVHLSGSFQNDLVGVLNLPLA